MEGRNEAEVLVPSIRVCRFRFSRRRLSRGKAMATRRVGQILMRTTAAPRYALQGIKRYSPTFLKVRQKAHLIVEYKQKRTYIDLFCFYNLGIKMDERIFS